MKYLISIVMEYVRVNRKVIEEFCKNHLRTHTDWTGTYVETAFKCDSVDKFTNMLIEHIEDNQDKFNV